MTDGAIVCEGVSGVTSAWAPPGRAFWGSAEIGAGWGVVQGPAATGVEDVTALTELEKIRARLLAMQTMEDGWLDGGGRAPVRQTLARAGEVLEAIFSDHPSLGRPGIFPTPEGRVQAEWLVGRWAAEATFDAQGGVVMLEATHADTLEDRTRRVPIGPRCAATVGAWIAALARSDAGV